MGMSATHIKPLGPILQSSSSIDVNGDVLQLTCSHLRKEVAGRVQRDHEEKGGGASGWNCLASVSNKANIRRKIYRAYFIEWGAGN